MKKLFSILILVILALGFFSGTGFYIWQSQKDGFYKWGSPDETANYFFAKLYAREGKLAYYEPDNLRSSEIIHPRSFRSDEGKLKPVSFIGLPLVYGKIGAITTDKAIGYLTPLFAALGIIFYYSLVRKFFSRRVALFSAFLLAIFPVYFYYSARSMFHNVLFTVFLIIGLYFTLSSAIQDNQDGKNPKNDPGVKNPENGEKNISAGGSDEYPGEKSRWKRFLARPGWLCARNLTYAGLGGLFIGLAVTARASELLWLGPALFIIWVFNFWRFGLSRLVLFLSFFVLALLPMLHWNIILYDSAAQGGYPEMNQSISTVTGKGLGLAKALPGIFHGRLDSLKEAGSAIGDAIFKFGLDFSRSKKIFNLYFIKMFPWIFWPAIAAAPIFFLRFKKIRKRHIIYLLAYTFLSIILVLYYGSWEFYDNPDKNAATIGNSYTRYWLPVYLGAIPFAAWLLLKVAELPVKIFKIAKRIGQWKFWPDAAGFKLEKLRGLSVIFSGFLVFLAILIAGYLNFNFLLFGSEEGLVPTYHKSQAARIEYEKIINLTEEKAVIVTRYHDKLFFPERRVVVGLFDDPNMIAAYANIAGLAPLYYYNFTLPDASVAYLNNSRLKNAGLKIEKLETVTADFTLYKMSLVK